MPLHRRRVEIAERLRGYVPAEAAFEDRGMFEAYRKPSGYFAGKPDDTLRRIRTIRIVAHVFQKSFFFAAISSVFTAGDDYKRQDPPPKLPLSQSRRGRGSTKQPRPPLHARQNLSFSGRADITVPFKPRLDRSDTS